jgi:hypothetical protein
MNQFSPNSKYDHAFAIIRVDSFHGLEAAPEEAVTVTKVVFDQEAAKAEVARLNGLNEGKGCTYFWHITRVERSGARQTNTGIRQEA